MNAILLRTTLAAAALAVSACASTGPAPVEVTRFHLGQQVARATIAVEPVAAQDRGSLQFASYQASVERQLQALGWTIAPAGAASEQIALVGVEQGTRAAAPRRSPISIGLGGSTGGYRSGVGAGINFGLGGGKPGDLVVTMMDVSIRRRSDSTVFWEGRAQTEARSGTPEASGNVAAEKLANALFRDFPGESGRTIRVP